MDFQFLQFILLYAYEGFVLLYVYAPCTLPGPQGGQKRESREGELEFQALVNHHLGGNQTPIPSLGEQTVLSTTELYLQPPVLFLVSVERNYL